MGHAKKTRQKFDPKKFESTKESQKKKDKDWTFEDVLRSKPRRR